MLTRTETSKLYIASFFARKPYSLCVPTDRRTTVVGKGLEMWVATTVDHQNELVNKIYECLLSRLERGTSTQVTV
jgi:hypothetical protein